MTSPVTLPGPSPPNRWAVSAHGLGRSFEAVRALDALSFEVRDGELFGVVGPDGAGKTTLLRILAGVLPPTAGDVHVLGWSMSREPEGPKPQLAYMAQRFGLYEDLTVAENLAFYADLYRVPRIERGGRLERLFRFSGLEPFRSRLAGNLSGGMKQKLALSCCLIHEPSVLLLDEPTFGVDPISRRELWRILKEMISRGITVILSTSYLDEAERCDRVLLLDQGQAMQVDTPARLLAGLPGTLLLVETPEPRRARDVLRGSGQVESATLFGERLHVLLPRADRWEKDWQGAGDLLQTAGLDVRSVQPIDPSLEDVFIHQIRGRRSEATAGSPHG